MARQSTSSDHDLLGLSAVPRRKWAELRPDFLIISPAKTGTNWLAANLRCHPQCFVPASKEVKYFSSLYPQFDANWYLNQFTGGAGRIKGEASPSYALLPRETIRQIHRLMPDVKLVFLMREPISRAWSHARHACRYEEASFTGHPVDLPDVTDQQWNACFSHDWLLANSDYLGQLRRWLSIFPRKQFYVGFYESIADEPRSLLRDLFAFLGLSPEVDLSTFPVTEVVFPGPARELSPSQRILLQQLLQDRTAELTAFLHEQFDLQLPPSWSSSRTFDGPASLLSGGPFWASTDQCPHREDRFLAGVLEQEKEFPWAECPILEGYRGYNIILRQGRLYALERALGPVELRNWGPADFERNQRDKNCFVAFCLEDLKDQIDQHVFDRTRAEMLNHHTTQMDRLENLGRELRREAQAQLRESEIKFNKALHRITNLEDSLIEAYKVIRHLDAHALCLSDRQMAVVRSLRGARQWLREKVSWLFQRAVSLIRPVRASRGEIALPRADSPSPKRAAQECTSASK